jgi:hypothetical protein
LDGIKEYIEVIIAIMIIMAITVIGTTATSEVVLLVTQVAGVIVDLLVIRVMEAQVIQTTVVLSVGIQKVLFFVMAIPLFVTQALLLVQQVLLPQLPLLLVTQVVLMAL